MIAAPNWRKLGNEALDAGDLVDAERCYNNALQLAPDDATALVNLAFVKSELRSYDESKSLLEQAVLLDSSNMDAWYMLGGLLERAENLPLAKAALLKAIELQPDFELAYRDLSRVLFHSGELTLAKKIIQRGIELNPLSPDFHFYLGNIHLQCGQFQEAQASFRRTVQLEPKNPEPLINVGLALHNQGDVYAAIDAFNSALELAPNDAIALRNMGGALQVSGDLRHAIECYRKALEVAPNDTAAHQNLLYALSFDQECLPDKYLQAVRRFGNESSARAMPFSHWGWTAMPSNRRPLRIGFVSGDLRNHPVGNFLEGVLANIDPAKLTLAAYSTWLKDDDLTARIKAFFAEWNLVASLTDQQLASKIHNDKIDILVDLAGHTAHNRLPVFAWRPAPIQVAWLGYWASTGVSEIDYILVDAVSVPESGRQFFSERPWYLPDTRFCFTPPVAAQPIATSDLPALRKGYVTFGSFQSLGKMNDAVLAVWSRVLAALPDARLRLQNWQLGYPAAQKEMLRRLTGMGIGLNRIEIHGGVSRDRYLWAYSEVDIILDTFPFPGGTTTLEALWMGVPTVTLTGITLLARQGESLLVCAGLGDWVALSEREYLALTVTHAQDLVALSVLRANLPARMRISPLFDAARFAQKFEAAMMGMWRDKFD